MSMREAGRAELVTASRTRDLCVLWLQRYMVDGGRSPEMAMGMLGLLPAPVLVEIGREVGDALGALPAALKKPAPLEGADREWKRMANELLADLRRIKAWEAQP